MVIVVVKVGGLSNRFFTIFLTSKVSSRPGETDPESVLERAKVQVLPEGRSSVNSLPVLRDIRVSLIIFVSYESRKKRLVLRENRRFSRGKFE